MQFGVSECVRHWGRYHPDSIAAYHNGDQATYGQLNRFVDSIADQLKDESAVRIAVAVTHKFWLLVAILAVIRCGKSVVILNPELPHDFIRTNLADTQPGLLLVDNENMNLATFVSKHLILDALIAERTSKACSKTVLNAKPSDEWGVLFSSGTTGIPKGIERDHESIVTENLGWCLELTLGRRSIFYIGRPVFYTGGLVLSLAILTAGGSLVLNDIKDDSEFRGTWEDFGRAKTTITLSHAFFIPDQLRCSLRTNVEVSQTDLVILTMGAPISSTEKKAVAEKLGCFVVESWGNSESLGTITEPSDLELRPDSIGRPFIGDELLIVDDEGSEQGPNRVGRIAGGEEAGFTRYSNRQKETTDVKKGGWIISSDIGYTDDNGFFYIKGRIEDSIIAGDKSVFFIELERILRNTGLVADCCVVPLAKGHETALGCVVVVPGSISKETLAQCIAEAIPKGIEVRFLFCDSLPRLPSGKVDKIRCKAIFNPNEV